MVIRDLKDQGVTVVGRRERFDIHTAVHRNIISITKATRCANVPNLFYFGMTLYIFIVVPCIL